MQTVINLVFLLTYDVLDYDATFVLLCRTNEEKFAMVYSTKTFFL